MARPKTAWYRLKGAKGIRYYEHTSRRYRNRPDRYYSVRWYRHGKEQEEGLGWASEGWNASDIILMRNQLQKNYKQGDTPTTFSELTALRRKEKEQAAATEKEDAIRSMTFRQFFEEHFIPWKRDRKKRASWNNDVMLCNRRIFDYMGDLPLDAITPDMLTEFIEALYADGLSDASVLHYMAVIRQVYNRASVTLIEGTAVFSGLTPIASIDLPNLSENCNARERYLTHEEAELILRTCRDKADTALRRSDKRAWYDVHDAILLSLTTGLRMGEIQRLEWSDLNFYGDTLVVKKAANRKPGGTIPLSSTAKAMLKERRSRCEKTTLVFPPINGGKRRENMSHAFKKIVDLLGLNDDTTSNSQRVVFHSLRHTFASWLAIAGVDIYRIKSLMRHKTLVMTQRYAHLIPDHSRDAVELIPIGKTTQQEP